MTPRLKADAGSHVEMSRQETKARRKEFRGEEQAVRNILNDWEPIGIHTPDDEYDCLVHHILSVLHRNGRLIDVKSTIEEQLRGHFGLTGVPEHEIDQTADRIWSWWLRWKEE